MVKSERLELIMEILTSQMNHWIFFPLVMTALGLFIKYSGTPADTGPGFLLWAACGLIPVVCFLFRNYVERFWSFVLCHGTVIGGMVFLATLLPVHSAILCVVCGALYTLYSFMLRLREDSSVYSDAINPLTALGISVAANFMFHRQDGMPDWDRYYMFILIGVFACYLIIYYLKHYLSFLRVNKSSAGYLPAKEILRSGIGFVLPYTLAGALILILSLNVAWLEPILGGLKEGLKLVLRFLVRLLPNSGNEEEPILSEDAGYAPEAGMVSLFPAETFWLWEVLEPLIFIVFICICAYGLIKAMKALVRFLREKFGSRPAKGGLNTGQESVYDIREKCIIEKRESAGKEAGLFQRFSPLERIRRLYKKRVLSSMTGGSKDRDREALNYMTARECGDRLALPDMADIYERARYSGGEATVEDVRQMKLACSGYSSR